MYVSVVTTKGQVVIPDRLRKKYGIRVGTKIQFAEENGEIILLPLTLEAAKIKANNKISYADAFTVALTKAEKAELVTGDKEFKAVERKIKMLWI